MSVAESRGMGTSTQSKNTNSYNRQNWEDAEFPILCETCLGDNPRIRMTKEKHGRECKICERPFTVFRWCPGAGMRFKKTEVCQTCAKLKNVCQTCLLDLEFGLPTQVRDAALGLKDGMPTSDVNREYYTQNMEKALADAGGLDHVGHITSGTKSAALSGRELLKKLARNKPYYKRNRAHICSFWVKGECRRGEECPYRHETPTDPNNPLAKQNMKDRYYGNNDPVALKMMKTADKKVKRLDPPADPNVMSLYIGNVEAPFVAKKDLQDYFYQFGEIRSISILPKQKAAFVHYTTRPAAEKAASESYQNLVIKGRRLKVLWGRSQGQKKKALEGGNTAALGQLQFQGNMVPSGNGFMPPPPPGMMRPPQQGMGGGRGRGRGRGGPRPSMPLYPSMNPSRMGARSAQPMRGAHEKQHQNR